METSLKVMMSSATITKINERLQRMGKALSFLQVSFFVGLERRAVVGILTIPQTIKMLKSKMQILFTYLALIPT